MFNEQYNSRHRAILDFMSNGYELGSDEENKDYLKSTFNLDDEQVDSLRHAWPYIRDSITEEEGLSIVKTCLIKMGDIPF